MGHDQVADQIRPNLLKLAGLMDAAEDNVLAYKTVPKDHRITLHSTKPLERLNGEVKRRTNVVGISPNEEATLRVFGAIVIEQNDEWSIQRARYEKVEAISTLREEAIVELPKPEAA